MRSAEAFWRQLHRDPVDIVLIDIGLPGEDGFSVLDYLHKIGHFGLVVITARGHEQDRLQALNAGADLYLIKPVNFSDLAESIHALGARLRQQSAPQPTAPTISAERLASSTLDITKRTVDCAIGADPAANAAGVPSAGTVNAQPQ